MRNLSRPLFFLIIILLIMGPGEALLRGGIMGLLNWVLDTLLILPGIVIGLSFHEFGHAKAAVLCGDNTPLYQGRVTLDPRAHVDLMGIVSLVFIHFGWGKPVMINPRNFKNSRRDSIIVGLAGVFMNFVLAVAFGFIIRLLFVFAPAIFSSNPGVNLYRILSNVIVINISLMLFNLLPIPPLDGFGVFTEIFNLRNTRFYDFVYSNAMMILLIMILLDVPGLLLTGPLNAIVRFILHTVCGM